MDYNNNDHRTANENNLEKFVEENNNYIENNNNNANTMNKKEDIRTRAYNNVSNHKKMVSFADLQDTNNSISTNTTYYYNNYGHNSNNINEANVKKNFNNSYRYNNRYKKGRLFHCSNQYRYNFQHQHQPSQQGYNNHQHNQNLQHKPRFTEQLNYKPQEQSHQEQQQQVQQQNSQQSYADRCHVYYKPEATLSYQQQLQKQQYELQQYYKQQKLNNYQFPQYSSQPRFNNFQDDKSPSLQQQQFQQQQTTSKQQFSWQQLQNHSKLEQPQHHQFLQQQAGYNSSRPQYFYNQPQIFYNTQFHKQYSDVKFKKPNFGSGRIIANPWGRNRKQRRFNPQFQPSRHSHPQYISSHNCVNFRFPQNTGTTPANSQIINNNLKTALHGGSSKGKKEINLLSSKLNPNSKPYQNLKSTSKANVVLINTPQETPKDVDIKNDVETAKVAKVLVNDFTKKEISEEKVLEEKKVQASVSDIVIKKDAERYALEKGLDSVNKDGVNDDDAEIEYDNGNNDGDDDEQWEDIDEEVCIELAHGFKHYDGEYEYTDDNVYYHGGDEADGDDEEGMRLNRSDESFQQFIIENTLNLEPSHMLGSNKRSSSMMMLPSSLSSLQPSLSSQTLIPGRLVSQLSYPDVLDWSDNVDSLTPLPSHREGADAGGGDDSAENSACGVFGNESGLCLDDDGGKNDEGDGGKMKRVFGVEGDDDGDTCSETYGDASDVGEFKNIEDLTGDGVEVLKESKGGESDRKDIKTCLKLEELSICESEHIVEDKEVIKDCYEKLTDVNGGGPLKCGDQVEKKIVNDVFCLETLKESGKSNECEGVMMTDNEKSRNVEDENVKDVCGTETTNVNCGENRKVDDVENIKS